MMATDHEITGATLLITGASRGLGQALTEEALRRGARRVYAGTRQPRPPHTDSRVTYLPLDVTSPEQIRRASETVGGLDILVNNAGVSTFDDLSDETALTEHLAVNLYGTYRVTRAFVAQLAAAGGALVNVSSLVAVAALPVLPAYSAAKAAAWSLTQSYRALLAGRGVSVHAVLAGPIDTDMSRDLPIAKTAPADVARAIFDGVSQGQDDIFPDPMSAAALAAGWDQSLAKSLERENAQYVAALTG
jgi:NAD(P)-dependent dehydrogenase (short-subunit alcohol dehydrogenase family)